MLLTTITKTLFRDDGTPKFVYYDNKGKHRRCCIILNMRTQHFQRIQKAFPIEGRVVAEVWEKVADDWLAAFDLLTDSPDWHRARAAFIKSATPFIERHGIQTSMQHIFIKPQKNEKNQ